MSIRTRFEIETFVLGAHPTPARKAHALQTELFQAREQQHPDLPVLEERINLNVLYASTLEASHLVAKEPLNLALTSDAETGVSQSVITALEPVVVNNTPLTRFTVPSPVPRSGKEELSVNSGNPTASYEAEI